MYRDSDEDKAIAACHKLISELWNEAKKVADEKCGGAGEASIPKVVIEFDKLRLKALADPVINTMVWALETTPTDTSGFLRLLPYRLVQEGKLIPYEALSDIRRPPGETIH